MAVAVITGASSGMGQACLERLRGTFADALSKVGHRSCRGSTCSWTVACPTADGSVGFVAPDRAGNSALSHHH